MLRKCAFFRFFLYSFILFLEKKKKKSLTLPFRHSISSPIESTDIFAYPGPNVDRSPRQPVRIQSENLGVGFQCLKCRKDKYKLWAKNEAIVRHLSDKYV
jgi:hypothetical protein